MTTQKLIQDLTTVAARMAAVVTAHAAGGRISLSVADVARLEKLIRRAADTIQHQQQTLQDQEAQMGKTADAINQLESALTANQTALNNAQANTLDATDQAAIAGVPSFLAGLTSTAPATPTPATTATPTDTSTTVATPTIPTGSASGPATTADTVPAGAGGQ